MGDIQNTDNIESNIDNNNNNNVSLESSSSSQNNNTNTTTTTTTTSVDNLQVGVLSISDQSTPTIETPNQQQQQQQDDNNRGVSNETIKASLDGLKHNSLKTTFPNSTNHQYIDVNTQWITNKLKERESEFTEKRGMSIFLGTWNVNGKKPSESLDPWLKDPSMSLQPDIYAIGFQELDLTAEALLLGDTTRSLPWEQHILNTLQGDYVKLLSKQLVGILLCVYVKKEHKPHIANVQSDIAAVGIMGMMGNKGGVAIRFSFYNTTICILNSHLNAHMDNVLRRNQDMKDISKNIKFINESSTDHSTINIFDHDQLFWIGDLNYRIPLPDNEVKEKIKKKDFYNLFLVDQLNQQMKAGAVFEGFQEPPISFAPTYKYDAGTEEYDSSEKKRTPAWCDRILWKTHKKAENVGILSYKRAELISSDHRPVSASFVIKIKVVIPDSKNRIYQEIVKELDKKENDSMPDANISTNMVDFETIKFMQPISKQLIFENIGQVIARFQFIPKLDETILCKPWLKISPLAGMMIPKEKVTIDLTIYVDNLTSGLFNINNNSTNSTNESMDDILILHLENGKDYFISISGKFQKTCFGNTLDNLVRYPHPIRNNLPIPPEQKKLSIPKELWRIIDYIYYNGLKEEGLFIKSGVTKEMELIRDCLDTAEPFSSISFSIHSMAETLIRFLESLVEPVIPFNMYQQALDASSSPLSCKTLVSHLPSVNYNVFFYLISFLIETLSNQKENDLKPDQLAIIFSTVLLRPSPQSQLSQFPPDATTVKKKADLILHFLISKDLIN
ncbi:RhoGAP domain-containing protein [Dictyostelium discoideum AX4]|uniref:Inositol 5-phosphatase 4 n=1 Tax=Dictyostelium discoideum TaxID=44689 RepID=Q8I7P3_DICDI|nr:RhoGAP domain-containing protein [Dictyostelium discoideum AX4]AAN85440.1 inositol 5-phosphatase 4 [Dictyostelium discoideum]EAL73184.1 RhoGAP domain-containing protein [Dictyostelium discoideum AX4]|eukprot:XP_647668.1 RhoGAP domain-containing protein [Dictyostelium discoideum AX4]